VVLSITPKARGSISLRNDLFLDPGAIKDDAIGAAVESVNLYARESAIGGTVYRARLIASLMDVPGVRSLALDERADDVALDADTTFAPTCRLTASRLA
jgi:phage-related baseplate assembly protein